MVGAVGAERGAGRDERVKNEDGTRDNHGPERDPLRLAGVAFPPGLHAMCLPGQRVMPPVHARPECDHDADDYEQ